MPDEDIDLQGSLTHLAGDYAATGELLARTRARVAQRRGRRRAAVACGGAALALVGAVAIPTVLDDPSEDQPVLVDRPVGTDTTAHDPPTTSIAGCDGREVVETADVDGDGRSDDVFTGWVDEHRNATSPETGVFELGVCTADGRVATNVDGGNGEALRVADVNGDGRDEVLFGGTTASAAYYSIGVLVGDELLTATVGREPLQLAEGSTGGFDEDIGEPLATAAFGCEDLTGDERTELVQVTATFEGTAVSWTKTGYALDGAELTHVFDDDGTGAAPADRFALPMSLTVPCEPSDDTSTTTVVDEVLVQQIPEAQRSAVNAFSHFAKDPTDRRRADAVPFAEEVRIGLGSQLLASVATAEVTDPERWELDLEMRWGMEGAASALDLLRNEGDLMIDTEPPSCGGGLDLAPPAEVAAQVRLSLQPLGSRSCFEWFSVDVYLDSNDVITAVTVTLYEP